MPLFQYYCQRGKGKNLKIFGHFEIKPSDSQLVRVNAAVLMARLSFLFSFSPTDKIEQLSWSDILGR